MKLAHIVPVHYLPYVPLSQRTHLCLSNLVVSNPRYGKYFAAKAADGDLVILDNPVHENIDPNITTWLEAIKIVHPTVAVLPDAIESPTMTMKLSRWGVDTVRAEFGYPVQLMGVPHGDNDDDFVDCAAELVKMGASWLGVSLERRLNNDVTAYAVRCRRLQILRYLTKPKYGVKFHLLGISEESREFTNPAVQSQVTSGDASKYAVWWLTGKPQRPPVPITDKYEGRIAFGGSMEYMYYQGGVTADFGDNLAAWTAYAEKGEL